MQKLFRRCNGKFFFGDGRLNVKISSGRLKIMFGRLNVWMSKFEELHETNKNLRSYAKLTGFEELRKLTGFDELHKIDQI